MEELAGIRIVDTDAGDGLPPVYLTGVGQQSSP